MTLYEWLEKMGNSQDQRLVSISLPEKTLHYDGKLIMRCGEILVSELSLGDELVEIDGIINFCGDPYAEIERLFEQFHRSVPSKRDTINAGYFMADSSDSLSMAELENNMPRLQARLLLEGFVLLTSSINAIPWHNPRHFFWRGTNPQLFLYREWILAN